MQHNAAFHWGLHCLLRLKQSSGTEVHHSLENSTCDPFKYTMGRSINIVSICMGKSIRIQRVNVIPAAVFHLSFFVCSSFVGLHEFLTYSFDYFHSLFQHCDLDLFGKNW